MFDLETLALCLYTIIIVTIAVMLKVSSDRQPFNMTPPDGEPLIGVRFAATLVGKALTDGDIERPHDWKQVVFDLSKKSKKRAYNDYLRWRRNYFGLFCFNGLDHNTHDGMSTYLTHKYKDEFAHLIRTPDGIPIWNQFGCPRTGNDYDVAILVNEVHKPLYPGEEESFIAYFRNLEFVDPNKEIDICYLSNKDESFQTNKGGPETANIVFHSYKWHPQHHPCIFTESDLVKVWTSDKLITISKFIMDNAEDMMSPDVYNTFREHKHQVYHSGAERFLLTFDLFAQLETDGHYGLWKSITMKLIQTYLTSVDPDYHLNPSHYDKLLMSQEFGKHFPDKASDVESCLLYKTRDTGFPVGLKEFLLEKVYKPLFQSHYPMLSKEFIDIDPSLNNPTLLPDAIYQLFLTSPNKMPDGFAPLWFSHYGESCSIGKEFVEPCQNVEILMRFPTLWSRVLTMPQRSDEWMQAYHHDYKTGRAGGIRVIPDEATPTQRLSRLYNLIMGATGEMIVSDNIDWSTLIGQPCQFASIGMISQGGLGTQAYCPDGLLVLEDDTIVALEFKTIYDESEPRDGTNFIREYNLARLQLGGAIRVINQDSPTPLATYGIVVFMFIYPHEGGYNYRLHTNRIDYMGSDLYF